MGNKKSKNTVPAEKLTIRVQRNTEKRVRTKPVYEKHEMNVKNANKLQRRKDLGWCDQRGYLHLQEDAIRWIRIIKIEKGRRSPSRGMLKTSREWKSKVHSRAEYNQLG